MNSPRVSAAAPEGRCVTQQNDVTSAGLASAVLIGFGSVGRFLGQVLANRYPKFAIVARTDATLARVADAHPDAVAAKTLEELDGAGWEWTNCLAVIATWGPSHAAYFDSVVHRGVRHVLCEKPLADSVFAGAQMISKASELGVALGTHQQRPYIGLVSGLKQLAGELELGEPYSLVIHGGAIGLVTMGVHYIGFATELFGGGPERVISTARGDPINPRSPDLMYYGGTAIWSFGDGREAVFSFSNHSSAGPTVEIQYRNAIVTLAMDNTVIVRHRDRSQLAAYPRVTRTGDPLEFAYDGALPGIRTSEQGTLAIIEEIESGDVRIFPPESALQSMGACIGALEAGTSGQAVQLPIDPMSDIGRRQWPIS